MATGKGASTNDDYLGNCRFMVELEGLSVGAFRTATGLDSKQEVIEYRLGGDDAVRRKPGRITYSNIVLERGFTSDTTLSEWRQKIEQGEDDRRSGSVVMLDKDDTEAMRWNFYRAWPIAWEAPGLTAGANELAVEKLELAVEKVELKRG